MTDARADGYFLTTYDSPDSDDGYYGNCIGIMAENQGPIPDPNSNTYSFRVDKLILADSGDSPS